MKWFVAVVLFGFCSLAWGEEQPVASAPSLADRLQKCEADVAIQKATQEAAWQEYQTHLKREADVLQQAQAADQAGRQALADRLDQQVKAEQSQEAEWNKKFEAAGAAVSALQSQINWIKQTLADHEQRMRVVEEDNQLHLTQAFSGHAAAQNSFIGWFRSIGGLFRQEADSRYIRKDEARAIVSQMVGEEINRSTVVPPVISAPLSFKDAPRIPSPHGVRLNGPGRAHPTLGGSQHWEVAEIEKAFRFLALLAGMLITGCVLTSHFFSEKDRVWPLVSKRELRWAAICFMGLAVFLLLPWLQSAAARILWAA